MGKFLSSIILLIILNGCSEDEKQPNQPTELYGSVSGIIYDFATEEKISGATITTDPPTINSISDSVGNYKLIDIPPAQYQIIANKSGYIENYVNVVIQAGRNISINIPLAYEALTGNISGSIYDLDTGDKISGATVTTNPPTINSLSDSAGNYTLDNIPPGQYQVIANKSGYMQNYFNTLVQSGQNIVIDIPLQTEIINNSWQETNFFDIVLGGGNLGTISKIGRNSAGHIFIAVVDSINNQGRIYRMVVDDLNWLEISNGLPNNLFKVEKFVFSSADLILVDLGMNGIYLTSNSGLNWEQIANYPEGHIGISDKLFIDDADNLFIIRQTLTHNKLFKSLDTGNNWFEINGWGTEINTLAFINVNNNNGIYAGTHSGKILRSTNNGQNWELLKEISGVEVIQIISSKVGNLLGVFSNDFGIYISTDIGWSWNSVLPGNTSKTEIVSTKDFGLYVTINSNLYRSTTEGRNWYLWNEGLPPNNLSNEIINITYSGSYIYCSSSIGRVYRRLP